jgi:Fic family protein
VKFIYQYKGWPKFHWDAARLAVLLADVRHRQGRLIGRMESLGFSLRSEAVLQTLTEEVIRSSEIEGEQLNRTQVRSSVARRLGLDVAGLVRADRKVEGVVEMMLDATQKYNEPLTQKRLFNWHAALFPTGRSGMTEITVGKWRNDHTGPMQVISGPVGSPVIHFEAPPASALKLHTQAFIKWMNDTNSIDPVLKAGIAHFWFVTLHPFDDGNGRIARAIADMALARSEASPHRFYSMSETICAQRKDYYDILESTQKGDLNITPWLEWFLGCLKRAIGGAEIVLSSVLTKARFWDTNRAAHFNDRQKHVINRLFDGFEGKLTSSKWAVLTKCSQDTASRDIDDLLKRGILIKNPGGGRSTSYSLKP